MTIKVGINGLGRIGRAILRAAFQSPEFREIEVVAINDLAPVHVLAHLIKYDSIYGRFPLEVSYNSDKIIINRQEIKTFSQKTPRQIPWQEEGVEFVIEATGRFTDTREAEGHLLSGAQKVIITAPSPNAHFTVVLGVNEQKYNPFHHHIVSNASCTTNCLAPIVKLISESFGVEGVFLNAIHSYTMDHRLVDSSHRNLRRGRSIARNIIPTETGAISALDQLLKDLEDRFYLMNIRVPTGSVCLMDIILRLERSVGIKELNAFFRKRQNRYVSYIEEPVVSSDFRGNPHSAIIDGLCTQVIQGKLARVMAWFDNEWGYANRVLDLILYMEGIKRFFKIPSSSFPPL